MQHWFYSLKRQEQIVLLFGIVVVFSYLLYVVVLRPLSAAVERLEQKNEVADRKSTRLNSSH